MTFYEHTDKVSGDGLALSQWNDLSSAVAGNSGLRLALAAEDRIGIGIANPTAKLSVQGETRLAGKVTIDTAAGETGLDMATADSYAEMRVIRNSISENKMLYLNWGITGGAIGLYSNTSIQGSLSVKDHLSIGGESDVSKLSIINIGGNDGVKMLSFGEGDDPAFWFESGFAPSDGENFMSLSSFRGNPIMAWKMDGRVGIGTASPDAKLEVDAGGGNTIGLVVNGRIRSTGRKGGMWVGDTQFVGKTGNNIGFYNNAWHLKVAADGNIGIGKDPTGNKLEVNGTIKANKIKIGSTEISENDLKVLRKLASDKLVVKIKSNVNDAILDHFRGNINQGDGERTVQFQNNNSGWSNHHTMTLLVKP